MKKTSFFRNRTLIQTVLIFILCIGLVPVKMAQADAAPPPDPTVGGVGPYQPIKTNVQMMSETVFIDVPHSSPEQPKPIRVNAIFVMRNQGQTEEQMQVIFPLSRLGYDNNPEQSVYLVGLSSFVAKVNDQPVPISQITTPGEPIEDYSKPVHGYSTDVLWAAFPVTFPVNQDVWLQVEYEMVNREAEIGTDFTGISYILETGAGWYGNILSANIKVRLPYLVEEEALRYIKPGYTISGRELQWALKDFEPSREDNLRLKVVQEGAWQTILGLRSEVQENPYDAEAWDKLAGSYKYLSIFYSNRSENFPYQLNHRTSDLAVEARRRVVELRPESGEAHFWLAEILWYTNPKVEAIWDLSDDPPIYIQPNDPSIQDVLHELDLAQSYGLSEDMRWDVQKLVEMINRSVPGLELAAPSVVTLTVTMFPPTETFVPTATETLPPTTSPTASPTLTLVPTVSPTLVPTETSSTTTLHAGLLSIVVGLALMIGIFIYQQKSKPNSMK